MTAGSVSRNSATSPASSRRVTPNTRRFYLTASVTYLSSCARLNAAWLTIGATMLRRTRYTVPQAAPSRAVASAASIPCSMCPSPNSALKTTTPTSAAAQVLLEAAQDERALNFFAQPAGDHHDDAERRACRAASASCPRTGCARRCAARRERQHQRQDDEARQEEERGTRRMPMSASRTTGRWPRNISRADSRCVRMKKKNEADDQCRVEQRDREDERRRETSRLGLHRACRAR